MKLKIMVWWYFYTEFPNEFFHGSIHLPAASDIVYHACIKSVISYLGISFSIGLILIGANKKIELKLEKML